MAVIMVVKVGWLTFFMEPADNGSFHSFRSLSGGNLVWAPSPWNISYRIHLWSAVPNTNLSTIGKPTRGIPDFTFLDFSCSAIILIYMANRFTLASNNCFGCFSAIILSNSLWSIQPDQLRNLFSHHFNNILLTWSQVDFGLLLPTHS